MLDEVELGTTNVSRRDAGTAAARSSLDYVSQGLAILRRRFWLLTLAGLLGMPLALGFSGLLTPRYNAHAELLFDLRDLRVFDNEVTPTTSQTDTAVALVESQVRVLGSDNVLRRVVDKLGLADDPEFSGAPQGLLGKIATTIAGFQNNIAKSDMGANSPGDTALQTLARQTYILRPERTFVIELTTGAESRDKAVKIAEAMVDAYLADLTQSRAKVMAAASASIDARLEALRKTLD